jgi:hypothetical protein
MVNRLYLQYNNDSSNLSFSNLFYNLPPVLFFLKIDVPVALAQSLFNLSAQALLNWDTLAQLTAIKLICFYIMLN